MRRRKPQDSPRPTRDEQQTGLALHHGPSAQRGQSAGSSGQASRSQPVAAEEGAVAAEGVGGAFGYLGGLAEEQQGNGRVGRGTRRQQHFR